MLWMMIHVYVLCSIGWWEFGGIQCRSKDTGFSELHKISGTVIHHHFFSNIKAIQ